MSDPATLLPLEQTLTPTDPAEVAQIVRAAADARTPIYPLGGAAGLRYGALPERCGIGLSLAGLKRVIDYPARDLTITVEAGITLAELAAQLAVERQRLPVDVPLPGKATIGGALATNANGPRRCAYGTLRDYLLGFRAVDGRGTVFNGGGRVVKNAAGYDMCKLIVGSLGTLAVTTQVTLMVRPIPEASAFVCCAVDDCDAAERALAAVTAGGLLPAAVELLAGAHPDLPSPACGRGGGGEGSPAPSRAPSFARILVGFEGPQVEVDWMVAQLGERWQACSARDINAVTGRDAATLWQQLADFGMTIANGESDLVAAVNVPPSAVTAVCRQLRETSAQLSLAAHATSGSIRIAVSGVRPEETAVLVDAKLRPLATAAGGNLVVIAAPAGARLAARDVWGPPPAGAPLMQLLKQQFDPAGILNPGRFLFPAAQIGSQT
jgi:glycolate oxidase FAD binding subunit